MNLTPPELTDLLERARAAGYNAGQTAAEADFLARPQQPSTLDAVSEWGVQMHQARENSIRREERIHSLEGYLDCYKRDHEASIKLIMELREQIKQQAWELNEWRTGKRRRDYCDTDDVAAQMRAEDYAESQQTEQEHKPNKKARRSLDLQSADEQILLQCEMIRTMHEQIARQTDTIEAQGQQVDTLAAERDHWRKQANERIGTVAELDGDNVRLKAENRELTTERDQERQAYALVDGLLQVELKRSAELTAERDDHKKALDLAQALLEVGEGDKARLDYLESLRDFRHCQVRVSDRDIGLEFVCCYEETDTVRQAIDKARTSAGAGAGSGGGGEQGVDNG